jgi:hypothetical protein
MTEKSCIDCKYCWIDDDTDLPRCHIPESKFYDQVWGKRYSSVNEMRSGGYVCGPAGNKFVPSWASRLLGWGR